MCQLNKVIKHEHHVTPTVKEMIGDLSCARIFSKLDLLQGYNHLKLVLESIYITTFSTHMDLMRYNFGISRPTEIFQNVICETLEGIDGTINISDDILVFCAQETQPEARGSIPAVKRERPNPQQECEHSKDKLEFFGYVFSKDGILPDRRKLRTWSIFRHHQ